jgi:hypothetical protein
MRIVARVLIAAAALAFSSGCASSDWIDRTLVTVDVTGTWYGRTDREFFLKLKQEGSRVTGSIRIIPYKLEGSLTGPIDGTVAGDVFRFKDWKGRVEGELTVSGDDMNGRVSTWEVRTISLRRVDSSSTR